jgi:hypothetical protein
VKNPEARDASADLVDQGGWSTRRRAIIAAALVSGLVATSLVWGGVTAMQAAAAHERREAHRIASLGSLLDDRSASAELLASSSAALTALHPEGATGLDVADRVRIEHDRLALELARPLDERAALTVIVAQDRLLDGARTDLMAVLDDATRAVIADGRAALERSGLATDARRDAVRAAIDAMTALRQGQPFSYSGRAAMLEATMTASLAVRESHAAEKAERERREAARRAAEEARQSSESRRPPKKAYVTLLEWCGVDEFDQIIWCEKRVEVIN